jgi:hypothetical protein
MRFWKQREQTSMTSCVCSSLLPLLSRRSTVASSQASRYSFSPLSISFIFLVSFSFSFSPTPTQLHEDGQLAQMVFDRTADAASISHPKFLDEFGLLKLAQDGRASDVFHRKSSTIVADPGARSVALHVFEPFDPANLVSLVSLGGVKLAMHILSLTSVSTSSSSSKEWGKVASSPTLLSAD